MSTTQAPPEAEKGVHYAAKKLDIRPDSVRRAVQQGRLDAEKVYAPVGGIGYYLRFTDEAIRAYKAGRDDRRKGRPRGT